MFRSQTPIQRTIVIRRLLIVLLLTAACTTDYGILRLSRETGKLFETYQVLPDYKYYYTGGQNEPEVIMGIHKDYFLQTSAWIPMENIDAEMLRSRVKAMTMQLGYAAHTRGGVIYSPTREAAGIWYSEIFKTSIKFGDNNTITVAVPQWHDTDDDGAWKTFFSK